MHLLSDETAALPANDAAEEDDLAALEHQVAQLQAQLIQLLQPES